MERVNILWSGGWDGTFRMLQLAQEKVNIHPIYVIDEKRESTENEKKAMNRIRELLIDKYQANVDEITYYKKSWILENCADENISKAFGRLREKYSVGKQYEWFALLCNKMKIKAECGVVHQYHGKVENAIDAENRMEEIAQDFLPGRFRIADNAKEPKTDAMIVFGGLIFPLIKLTKEDEKRIAEEQDWLEIMKLSWFCHSPIKGKPCGLCSPCEDAMNTGMEWRMPAESQRRYRHRKILKWLKRIRNKLLH